MTDSINSSDSNPALDATKLNIWKNFLHVQERANSKSENFKIIAVSKKQPVEKMEKLVEKGHKIFGENYVQELLEKNKYFEEQEIEWHFIGRLQRNKVKQLIGVADFIHSVDRLVLAKEISLQARKKNLIQKIFLQVNIGGEESKGGVLEGQFPDFYKGVKTLEHLEVVGLMCLPPLSESEEEMKQNFRKLSEFARQNLAQSQQFLSMGTTNDYHIAVEEGATHIRVGTAIFGERQS